MHLALLMRGEVGIALKKLCALFAVVLAQPRQIFYGLRILELCEMLLVVQVGVHLVEIANVPARLLLGVLSSDGWHGGCGVCGVQTVTYPRPLGSGFGEEVEECGNTEYGPCNWPADLENLWAFAAETLLMLPYPELELHCVVCRSKRYFALTFPCGIQVVHSVQMVVCCAALIVRELMFGVRTTPKGRERGVWRHSAATLTAPLTRTTKFIYSRNTQHRMLMSAIASRVSCY